MVAPPVVRRASVGAIILSASLMTAESFTGPPSSMLRNGRGRPP